MATGPVMAVSHRPFLATCRDRGEGDVCTHNLRVIKKGIIFLKEGT